MNPSSQKTKSERVTVTLKVSDRVQIVDHQIDEDQLFDALRNRYAKGTSLSKQKTLTLRTTYEVAGLRRVVYLKIRLTAITDRGPSASTEARCFGFEGEVVRGSHFSGDTPRGEVLKVEGYLVPKTGLGTFWAI